MIGQARLLKKQAYFAVEQREVADPLVRQPLFSAISLQQYFD